MSEPHSHIPFGEPGAGTYSKNATTCFDAIHHATSDMLEAIESIPFRRVEGAFTICDYGTADGGTSMQLITQCIQKVKQLYGEEQEVHVIYNDQPINDFKSLFLRVHGLLDAPTFKSEFNNVFVTASGTSFYNQIVPSGTIHLGFTATAAHWLSQSPGPLDDALTHPNCTNTEQTARYKEQARKDWDLFLVRRAAELAPGGRMCLVNLCVTKDGYFCGRSPREEKGFHVVMIDCWREMLQEDKITKDEYEGLYLKGYFRTEEESCAPMKPGGAGYKAGVRLISYREVDNPCRHWTAWTSGSDKAGSPAARAHAQRFVLDCRRWGNSEYLQAMNKARSEEEKSRLSEQVWKKIEDKITAAPEKHAVFFFESYLVIEKA